MKAKKCPHNRERYYCKDCGGKAFCKHGCRVARCLDCGGSEICEHNRQQSFCRECNGSQICEHNKQKPSCKKCGGSAICEHNKQKTTCKDCKGPQICEHNRIRSQCKDCGGSKICEHNMHVGSCRVCCPQNIFKAYRRKALSKGRTFQLTIEDFKSVILWPCLYCGEKEKPRGIDRVRNADGYEINNCVSCCSMCNFMKRHYSDIEFIAQCHRIVDYTLLGD